MEKSDIILVTGGAGFVGSNLLQYLYKEGYRYLWSLDNYSSGKIENHIQGINYIIGNTCEIQELCKDINPKWVFHFGEFSRIHASWYEVSNVMKSNLYGTSCVLEYCRHKNSFLIYSASSAILDKNGKQQHSTPYTWTKSKMVELIRNYQTWYNLNTLTVYFYNVYGPGQITDGPYATVLGIFEKAFIENKPLPVVLPGTQTRIFTHIDDIIDGIILSIKHYKNCDIPIGSNESISIIDLAKKFTDNIIYLEERKGDRKESSKVLKDYLREELNWKTKHILNDYLQTII